MGQDKNRRVVNAPGFNMVLPYLSTAAIIKNRLVKVGAVAATVKHTTGTSGRVVLGVTLNSATGAGLKVLVQVAGLATVVVSTRAVAAGAILRATSGAASTATFLGGTARSSTVAMTTALPVRPNTIGMALTSAAAAATIRSVTVMLNPTINNPALL